ncbi:MAG: AAA family ATPase [Candidatus Pacebacteria bacterium]|nr:AAA family ATPase [Candidatus Paceibacterota bacterium]
MHLKRLELNGFKSFAQKSEFVFDVPIIAIVGPNGSGKSNVVEAIRFVLGEQSVRSMRGKTGSDFIFKGPKSIPHLTKASVSIVFDNSDRVFHIQTLNNTIDVDFDEITLSREVYQDGTNKYLINGEEVRMRDIHELIASVNIGSSGHHIISQGEADRYLNANSKDRKELIEEALGLKIYQYRIKESEKKLKQALANLRESELLRREIAPHLRFLKKQVEIIEKAKVLREELLEKYLLYFAREDRLIHSLQEDIHKEELFLKQEKERIDALLENYSEESTFHSSFEEELKNQEQKIKNLREELSFLRQEQSRLEGILSVLKKQQSQDTTKEKIISYHEVKEFLLSFRQKLEQLTEENFSSEKSALLHTIHDFLDQQEKNDKPFVDDRELSLTLEKIETLQDKINKTLETESREQKKLSELALSIKQEEEEWRKQERVYYESLGQHKELLGKISLLENKKSALSLRVQSREEEYHEAMVLLGNLGDAISSHLAEKDTAMDEVIDPHEQEQFRREIERIKIRIEDIGGGSGGDVLEEYQEAQERDLFLEREINDINLSIQSLENIISELKQTLDKEFFLGVEKINEQFDRFFKLMFGGGKAALSLVETKKRKKKEQEDELLPEDDSKESETGVDIHVSLPRKKVSDLDMLSGGERSLTSIALLFALSQVNPPPFLVLDETDAALDEANSQRYGDMIESLSQFSQLIVVTHNRETMSRAQTLFGVTLGRDDASALLSLRLEDATKYAK